jgi:transcriptional regulator with XRE-family HTH domain
MQQNMSLSFGQTFPASNLTSSVKADLLHNLRSSKVYRHAFVEERVRTQLAIQIKTIREQRRMSRPTFARLLRKAASWVFRLEDPNQAAPTIPSLLNAAGAFDVDLDIRFRRFSELLNQMEGMGPKSFEVPSFEEEIQQGVFDTIEASAPSTVTSAATVPENNSPTPIEEYSAKKASEGGKKQLLGGSASEASINFARQSG